MAGRILFAPTCGSIVVLDCMRNDVGAKNLSPCHPANPAITNGTNPYIPEGRLLPISAKVS
ncbi:MAG: hypothetical protein LBT24_02475 [Tannerella sp.]|nr:hypothetical protein [Tannerella sp.]